MSEATSLTTTLSEAQGRWRPGPGRWSVAECLIHLAATARLYQPRLDQAATTVRSREREARGEFAPGWVGRRVVASMEPKAGSRMRAPASLVPPADVTLADAGRAFVEAQRALDATLVETAGLDLGSATLGSPVMPLLRLSLGTALALLAAHERRHLAQAQRVVQAPGFPAA